MWLFLASEVMLFGSLFSSYALLRSGAMSWPDQSSIVNLPLATVNTVVLIVSSVAIEQRLWFTPTRTGEWEIACSQLCGLGHYRMRGFYTIQTQADFAAWLASQPAGL